MTTKTPTANILDPIQETLDQRVFKGEDPRPQLVSFIERHFYSVLDTFVPDSRKYFDLYLTGSITTYQYSDESDIDISVIPHYEELVKATGLPDTNQVRRHLITLVINKLDGKIAPGTPHTLQHFVVPPGTTIQDLFKPGLRSAWSFKDRDWVVKPEKSRAHSIERELPGLYLRARNMAEKMKVALDTDPGAAKKLFSRIHKKRSEDQQKGYGDFSEGNIIYKYLLHEGLFERIKNELGVYIAADNNQSVIRFLVDQIHGMRGDVEKVRNFFVNNSQLGTPEERQAWVNEAYAIYQQEHQENRDNFNKLREQQELQKGVWGKYRWAYYNGKIAVQNVDPEHGGEWAHRVHYDMLEELGVDEGALFGTHDTPNPERVPNLYLGYADVNYQTGQVDVLGDQSYDYGGLEESILPQSVQNEITDAISNDAGLNKTAETFDTPLVNPVSYQYIPLGPAEMVDWAALSPDDKKRWRAIAQRQNNRAVKAGNPRGVSGEELHGLAIRYQGNCAYCGGPKANSWEHVIPLENGGGSTADNLLPVHIQCNSDMNAYDQKNNPKSNPGGINLSPAWLQWQAQPAKVAADRIQVIYDFDKDRIILGMKNAGLPSTVVVGTYHQADGSVTLNETANQWINAKYFKKLWRTSFPQYPLRVVHFHSKGVHERIGNSITVNNLTIDDESIGYVEAFAYVGPPYNELLDSGSSEHYELMYDFMAEHPEIDDANPLDQIPIVLGHLGQTEAIDETHFIFQQIYVADFQSHGQAALNTDSAELRRQGLIGLEKLGYKPLVDITGKLRRRWWTAS